MSIDSKLVFTVETLMAGIMIKQYNDGDLQFTERYPSLVTILQRYPTLPIAEASAMLQRVSNHYTMSILKGDNLTDFNKTLYELISSPEKVTLFHSGILKFLVNIDTNQQETQQIADLGSNSKYIGAIGDKIVIELRILKCSHISSKESGYSFYSAVAVTKGGDLVSFSPKDKINVTADYDYKIVGKVKEHQEDKYLNGFQVTRLNYCKLLDASS
jgi:hypothetical protein